MGQILVKPGVDFGTVLAPAGAKILDHLKSLASLLSFEIMITSARDGVHSGPGDPHHSGEAYDVRTHGLEPAQRDLLLEDIQTLGPRFYAFLEAPGTPNEHIHVQRAKSTTYGILDYLADA